AAGRDGHGPGHAPPSHVGVDASPAWLQSVVHRVGGRGRTAIQVGGLHDQAGRGDEGVNECATSSAAGPRTHCAHPSATLSWRRLAPGVVMVPFARIFTVCRSGHCVRSDALCRRIRGPLLVAAAMVAAFLAPRDTAAQAVSPNAALAPDSIRTIAVND